MFEIEKKKEIWTVGGDKGAVAIILKASAKQLVIIELKWNKMK